MQRTISCLQLVKSRGWYDFVIDMGSICRLEVDDVWPCKDVNGTDKPGYEGQT